MPSKLNIGPEIKYKVSQCNDSPSPFFVNASTESVPPLLEREEDADYFGI